MSSSLLAFDIKRALLNDTITSGQLDTFLADAEFLGASIPTIN